jgi:hypothetical protein
MEPARTLAQEGFTMKTLHEAFREKVRRFTRKETEKQVCRYEGTAQIRKRETGYYELEDFTL